MAISLSMSEFNWNDWTNPAGFWHRSFLPSILHCLIRKFGYLQKLGYFPLEHYPKLWTWIWPRQVDLIVNKTRSSLLLTPIRQSRSHGCLLQLQPSNCTALTGCGFVVPPVYTVDKITTDSVLHGSSVVAEVTAEIYHSNFVPNRHITKPHYATSSHASKFMYVTWN